MPFRVLNTPVCIPSETPIPKINMNKTTGLVPGGAGRFEESPIAKTPTISTAEVRNSSKKADTLVI